MSLLEAKLQDHSDDIMEVTDSADKQLAIELKVCILVNMIYLYSLMVLQQINNLPSN
jgi:hypothetical protein